jgi:hypothetical protein
MFVWNPTSILESLADHFVRFFPLLFPMIILGVMHYAIFGMVLGANYQTYRWVAVQGTLLKRGVEKQSGYRQYGYQTQLAYIYRFHGIEYRGESLTAFDPSASRRVIEARIRQIPEAGKSVSVYVNPKRPEQSVLKQGWPDWMSLIALLPVWSFLLIIDAVILYSLLLPVLKK